MLVVILSAIAAGYSFYLYRNKNISRKEKFFSDNVSLPRQSTMFFNKEPLESWSDIERQEAFLKFLIKEIKARENKSDYYSSEPIHVQVLNERNPDEMHVFRDLCPDEVIVRAKIYADLAKSVETCLTKEQVAKSSQKDLLKFYDDRYAVFLLGMKKAQFKRKRTGV